MTTTNILLLLLILIILNAFFSTAEFSIASSRKMKLQQLAVNGNKKAELVLGLSAMPNTFITVIQIGLNIIAILSGIFGEQSFTPTFAEAFRTIGFAEKFVEPLAISISVLLITTIFIIFGELIPKKLAFSNPEKVACSVITPLMFTLKVFRPFVWFLSTCAETILKLFNVEVKRDEEITFEEVSALINEGAEQGLLEHNEHKIIENVFSLTDRNILSAMTVKNDIVFLDINDTQEDIVGKLIKHPHARFLVCDTSLDNLLGYIDARDILKNILSNKPVAFSREQLKEQGLKTILTMPDSINLLDVLDKFRETRQDIAVVFNEFGMVVGLITLNDVLATLMGNVVSYIEDDQLIVQRDEKSWLIDGKASIEDVKKLFNWQVLPGEENYETISGFLMYKMKCIPRKAQRYEYENVVFEIVDIEGYRIDEVMVTIK
jgi:CBS domain containing-hemolysin-like protein